MSLPRFDVSLAKDAGRDELFRTPRRYNHRRHALKLIVTKDEVVNESRGGVARNQGGKCPRAEFMRQMKRGRQRLVLRAPVAESATRTERTGAR
jgi:hypothetical protein